MRGMPCGPCFLQKATKRATKSVTKSFCCSLCCSLCRSLCCSLMRATKTDGHTSFGSAARVKQAGASTCVRNRALDRVCVCVCDVAQPKKRRHAGRPDRVDHLFRAAVSDPCVGAGSGLHPAVLGLLDLATALRKPRVRRLCATKETTCRWIRQG